MYVESRHWMTNQFRQMITAFIQIDTDICVLFDRYRQRRQCRILLVYTDNESDEELFSYNMLIEPMRSQVIVLFRVEKSLTNINCLLDCLYVRRVKKTFPTQNIEISIFVLIDGSIESKGSGEG